MKKATLSAVVMLSTWATLIAAADLEWDLNKINHDKYTDLIERLRNKLEAKTCFQIPMMGKQKNPPDYVVFKLIFHGKKNILIALDSRNVYVVGYSDTSNGNPRAFILNDAHENARQKAFPEAYKANQVHVLDYGGRYADLRTNSGFRDMSKLELSRIILRSIADNIFGVNDIRDQIFKKDQGQFLFMVVVMIAEAVRFKYIEGKVTAKLNSEPFRPNNKTIYIVNQWDAISTAVAQAYQDGTFRREIELRDAKDERYTAREVNQVKRDMGLLLFEDGCAKVNNIEKTCAAAAFSLQVIETECAPILY